MSRALGRLRAIHDRLVSGDPTASSELFVAAQMPVARVVLSRRRLSGLSLDEAADLATDAIVFHIGAPGRYDPSRASLFTYLARIADRDAANLLRSRGRERKNFVRLVELTPLEGNDDGGDPERRVEAERLLRAYADEIAEDDVDRRVLELMLEGEQETAAYVGVLGVGDLPEPEQRAAVRRHRDRIEKRLRRLGEKLR